MDAPKRLTEFPWVVARISCKFCRRKGQYRTVRLAERYGADVELERLLEILAADCRYMRPGEKARKYEERCGVRFTDLDGAGPPHDRPPALVVPILKVVRR